MNYKELETATYDMLDLKLTELRKEIPIISFKNLIDYFENIILKNNKIYDLNDIAFYVMNIKINKVCEYLNFVEISTASNSDIKNDLESILEG
ncbi:hypothetical protein SCORR_v1c03490 [Spiroplasma corruscae]|uniref:Uncharacterized protein n=1 Tax=Spiroplasma corruscae TaxID=216934 RepID=A0A222EPC5_9MOLU|nr:hypothetical protein [Spiroplasma corruscae]ASP28123.1 hypothetical protein SCORR_v1c03490 [Spiroplasma corruscae]